MRIRPFVILIAVSAAASLIAAPPADSLESQLLKMFPVTTLASNQTQVKDMGSVLVIQKEGIKGTRASRAGAKFTGNTYKGGRIVHTGAGGLGGVIVHVPKVGAGVSDKLAEATKDLEVNERLYLLKLEIKDSSIVFDVQSCGACDSNTIDPTAVRAEVTFPFAKAIIAGSKADEIQKTINELFTVEDAKPATDPNAQPGGAPGGAPGGPPAGAPPPQAMPATPLPPRPQQVTTSAPARIVAGQSTDEVIAVLGQPTRVANVGAKQIYYYSDLSLKITFLNGKLSDAD